MSDMVKAGKILPRPQIDALQPFLAEFVQAQSAMEAARGRLHLAVQLALNCRADLKINFETFMVSEIEPPR